MARVIVQVKLADINGKEYTEGELLREFTVITKGRGAINIQSMASIIQGTIEAYEDKFRVENTKTYSVTNRRTG